MSNDSETFDLRSLRAESDLNIDVSQRSTILEKVEDFSSTANNEDQYISLREEKWVSIKPALFLGPHLKEVTSQKVFSRTQFRVPEITLSHYHNASVLPHYFLLNQRGQLSQDSFEEYTKSQDMAWYSDEDAFEQKGTRWCIPRVKANPYWLEQNKFNFEFAQHLPVEYISEPTLYLMAWHHNNVSHWFLDVFSRMWGKSFIPTKNLKVIVPTPLHPYMLECLHLFGFDDADIILARKDRVYKFNNLYCVSRLASQYNYISEECTQFYDFFKNHIKNFKTSQQRRIYVSRRDTTKRACVNEEDIEKALEAKGFTTVQTTALNLKERVELFSGADVVAGPCGAGLFHSLFMPSGTKVFVTGTPQMNKNSCAFNYIGTQKKQDTYIFSGRNIDNKNITTDNWKIDIDAFMNAIESALHY